jgi:hypothetical protein
MSKTHASSIALNISNGSYVRNTRFSDFGSVVTDTIFGQQAEADRRLEAIKAERGRKVKKVVDR